MAKSYPSIRPLAGYVNDIIKRTTMLQKWVDEGPPVVFWLSGFFFPHAFLTAVKQNFARKHHVPIDTVVFDFKCLPSGEAYSAAPDDGAYVDGMFMEGVRWNEAIMALDESEPKVLFSPAPMMKLVPCEQSQLSEYPCYQCPLYRTPERRGVLASTGHSTNFVMELAIPSVHPADHWIRRGAAMLLAPLD